MVSTPGFEPGPHWWEASALTTAPLGDIKISDLCLVQKYGRTREANCPTPLESHQTYADFYQNL